ncbi:ras-related protein Rab-28 [Aethina tumida]|uniref:ras-related protein Rab-28 n=1 Tax=Aethina tumida TaxID=116153 RepID=UPI00096B5A35|nr:ras-related protein Rab-28 [Aethina tumida]
MSDSEEETAEKQLRLVVVGDCGVGKTSLVRRFCFDEFSRQYTQTIGADFYIKRLILPGKHEITIRISDLSGGVDLRGPMVKNYLFKANMVILVYDITNSTSFENMSVWIRAVSEAVSNSVTCAIFGNKSDVEHSRAVRLDKTRQFQIENNLLGYIVSAKTGEAVNGSLSELIGKHFGICLSKLEKEKQAPVVRAELIVPSTDRSKSAVVQTNTSVCSLQ